MSLLQGSKELLSRVLEVAAADWNLQLGLLDSAIQNKDYPEIRKRVHRIKGAVQNFYYQELSEKLAVHEAAAEARKELDWVGFAKELKVELKFLEAEILKYLGGPS